MARMRAALTPCWALAPFSSILVNTATTCSRSCSSIAVVLEEFGDSIFEVWPPGSSASLAQQAFRRLQPLQPPVDLGANELHGVRGPVKRNRAGQDFVDNLPPNIVFFCHCRL